VSRERERRELRWTDSRRREYTDVWRQKNLSSVGAAIPYAVRLCNVFCDNPDGENHVLAVLAPNGEAPPLLMVSGDSGPRPRLVLEDAGLCDAMVWTADDGTVVVSSLGDPQDEFEGLWCVQCATDQAVSAAELHRALKRQSSRTPGVKARRVS